MPFILLLLTLVFLSPSFSVAATSETQPLSKTLYFGVVPQQSAKKMAELWSPVLCYISHASGVKLQFATAKDIPEFEKRLLAGEYDIAYMNPYHYVVFHQKPGYEVIARQKDKRIQGIIVVRHDSPIKTLADLQGHLLAFPSPAAFAASILPRAYLKQEGIRFTTKYVSSHDSVYLGVVHKFFPAGGGVIRTLNNTAPEIRKQLRILWKTPAYTPHAIAAHPRVSIETRQKIIRAMLEMNHDPQGMIFLNTLNFKGFEAASDKQWDDIRQLNIHLLDNLLEE